MNLITRLSNAYKAFTDKGFDDLPYYRDMSGNHVMNNIELFTKWSFSERKDMKAYYSDCPFLADCINLYADFASQVQIYEEDEKGNIKEDTPFIDLLKKPNPFQDFQTFMKEAVINVITQGIYINYGTFYERGDLKIDSQIYNLDYANLTFPEINDSYLLRERDVKQLKIVENLANGKTRNHNLSELAFFYDLGKKGNTKSSNDFLNPVQRLRPIEKSIQNIINIEETINYLTKNKVYGALSKKGGGLTALGGAEKVDIETKVNGKKRGIVATNEEMNYLSFLIDAKKLQLVEFENQAKENIRNCLLIPRDILDASSGEAKGSTYENQQFAESRFINGNVKGYTDQILNAIATKAPKYFAARGTKLKGSFEHMPSQVAINQKLGSEALNDKLSALKAFFDAYGLALQNGVKIDYQQFLYENGFEGINTTEITPENNNSNGN